MNKQNTAAVWLLTLAFTLLYILLPSHNNTADAYGYAYAIQSGVDLFSPHHLLYNAFGRALLIVCSSFSITALPLMLVVNALFAGGCLLCFVKMVHIIKPKQNPIYPLVFVASCFGFMRFATENETYIIPIFFSLLGTYFFLLYERDGLAKHIWFSFTALTVAVLFHQIHVFWFVSIAMSSLIYHRKTISVVICGVLSIAGAYFLTAILLHVPPLNYPFTDATLGRVQLWPNIDNVQFTCINFMRTFVQIHGNVLVIVKKMWWAQLGVALSFSTFIGTCFYLIIRFPKQQKLQQYFYTKIGIIGATITHFIFAFYSVGNAEFMVMLPILLILLSLFYIRIHSRLWIFSSLTMLCWNITVALLPANGLDYENVSQTLAKTNRRGDQVYIAQNKQLLENASDYLQSVNVLPQIPIIWQRPGSMLADSTTLNDVIKNSAERQIPVYTDCINYPQMINRMKMLHNYENNTAYLDAYVKEIVDSTHCFYGTIYLYQVKIR